MNKVWKEKWKKWLVVIKNMMFKEYLEYWIIKKIHLKRWKKEKLSRHEITWEMNEGHFWPMLCIRRGAHVLRIKGLSLWWLLHFLKNVQNCLYHRNTNQNTVLVVSSVCIDGIKYSADMVISVGSCSGLPDFRQIAKNRGDQNRHNICLQTYDLMVYWASSSIWAL